MTGQSSTSQQKTFDVSSADILRVLFSPENIRRTIRRMRPWQESENEVAHPLRKLILIEYEQALAEGLSASVPSGSWKPSPAYVMLVAKRTGTYREISFPALLDTIVGRRIIDALEPFITDGDNNRVFFGRSHSNADRERGDYENWFKVWLDFSAEIASALQAGGFTYVFDTDVTQFFPSVDRERAKAALAQRTRAHQTLLELLFYCLETWAPRIRYCAVPGLPIEPNDVSRLVAHNYIKAVDEHFVNDEAVHYLRWVDDTVIFVPDEQRAHDVKRCHHLALREMGLSPNAAKTVIVTARDYGASRHPDFNRRITFAQEAADARATAELVDEWYAKDRTTPNWDKVASRLYSLARKAGSDALLSHALEDVREHQRLVPAALKYMRAFELDEHRLGGLLQQYGHFTCSVETRIEIARFLCDARLATDSRSLVDAAVGRVLEKDTRPGSGYARALFLLCLHKYGGRQHRDRVRNGLKLDDLHDDQLRLHYLYVFYCRKELDEAMARSVRHLDTTDISLLMRLCEDAARGELRNHSKCLATCRTTHAKRFTIQARYLPFLHALLRAPGRTADNEKWLANNAREPYLSKYDDAAIRQFLSDEWTAAMR